MSTNAPAMPATVADRFSGKHVLVTGAGSGIGAATVRHFVAEGAHVTGVDMNDDGLKAVHDSLEKRGDAFQRITADVTDKTQQEDFIELASRTGGVLDVLVNNAAVFLLAGLHASDEQWRRTLEVNLLAPAELVKKSAHALELADNGSVINIASVSAHISQADRWTYNASKGGVLALTRCQALDLAPRGIRVNSVSPGYIWTEVLDRAAKGDRDTWERVWGSACPLRRCGEPHEVAGVIAFLASRAASFMTGVDLLVDGGMLSMAPDGLAKFEFSS